MVLVPLLLLGAGAVAFFSAGGINKVRAFAETIPTTTDKKLGTTVVPTLQSGSGTVPIASGSSRTVNSLVTTEVLRTSIAQKRKFSPSADKEPIKTIFNNPKEGGVLDSQIGQIVGSNTSIEKTTKFGQGKFGLSEQEITAIRSKEFTDQEKQDIANLTLRFNRKTISAQKVSDQPEEIIFKKREQEALAKKLIRDQLGAGSFVIEGGLSIGAGRKTPESLVTPSGAVQVEGAFRGQPVIDFSRPLRGLTPRGFSLTGGKGVQEKLFGKPNFIFGGVSVEEFQAQRKEKEEQFARIQEVNRLQKEAQEKGEVILRGISASGQTQREFLLARGIALRGSSLNARALAGLQAKGLI